MTVPPMEYLAARRQVHPALPREAHGLAEEVREIADYTVSIPMHGKVESLNVATTGAVLAFDVAARRN